MNYFNFANFLLIFILFFVEICGEEELSENEYGISPITGIDFTPAWLNEGTKNGNTPHAYYAKDGRCGWWDVNLGKYVQPTLKYPNAFEQNDKEKNEYTLEKGKRFCLYQFHQVAMPLCGDEWYSQIKYCAMVDFYKNLAPHPVKIGNTNSDAVLFMIDGCVMCTDDDSYNNETKIKIQLKHKWKGGSFFTKCDETQNVASEINVNLIKQEFYDILVTTSDPKTALIEDVGNAIRYQAYLKAYSSSFTIAAVLYNRVCTGLFSKDDESTYFYNIQLEVTHGCGINKKFTIDLNDIVPSKFKNNMVELRGMMLLLTNSEWMQYYTEGYKFEMPSSLPDGKPVYDNAKGLDD